MTSQSKDFAYLVADKGWLRIQFKRRISQELWHKDKKILYLGLSDTSENRDVATAILIKIKNDIRAERLQPLNDYLPIAKTKQKNGGFFSNENLDIKITLLELYERYCEYIKPSLKDATYYDDYRGTFLNFLKRCNQNLNQQAEIVDKLYNIAGSHAFKRLCCLLFKLINWGKNRELIPEDAKNKFKVLMEERKVYLAKRKPGKLITAIKDYQASDSYKGFSAPETEIVITSFFERANSKYRVNRELVNARHKASRWLAYYYVCFCFATGCRTEEASGLRWQDLDIDSNLINFKSAWSASQNKLVSLKTEHIGQEGTKSRKFPCDRNLQQLINVLKEKYYRGNKDGLVFTIPHAQIKGRPFSHRHLGVQWYGHTNKKRGYVIKGIVTKLVEQKKITQYLSPYAMRHTWINQQIIAGTPLPDIAYLAGNSVEVIMKYYVSIRKVEEMSIKFPTPAMPGIIAARV